MKKLGFILLFTWFYSLANAGILDSILVFKNLEPDFGLDGFNTAVKSHNVNFSGIKAGIQWQEKYTAGLSYYTLGSNVNENMAYQNHTIHTSLLMSYVAVYMEYTYFENEKWELNAGTKIGFGNIYNQFTENSGSNTKINTTYYPLLAPYLSGSYKIRYWLGLGAALGITLVPVQNVSAPFVDIGIEIYFKPLYHKFIRPVFQKKKKL